MQKKKIDIELVTNFKGRSSFSRDELLNFYNKFDPDLNQKTFSWRIYDLKKRNIIISIGPGLYKVSNKPSFKSGIDQKIKKINSFIGEKYLEISPVLWNIKWVNDLSVHQVFKTFYLVEVPNELAKSVFNQLQTTNLGKVFINPTQDVMHQYVTNEHDPIIVKSLISRAPTQNISKVKIPTLEKILVDLFCDEKIFYMFHGHELKTIYRNAISDYAVNFKKLFNYAKRRRREKEIKEFFSINFPEILKDIPL
ncbi:MAG: hypothetical protein C4517_04965 [Stygiobacter sp.]|nr:MAG: hypothetical protein C4517_04965 [Stygiobacter sp.]